MKLLLLKLSALAFASAQFFEDVCVIYTVVEHPIFTTTCYASSSSSTSCVHVVSTSSETINALATTASIQYTTLTTDVYTTVCPSPTTFTYGSLTYTVTEATIITITGLS